MEKTYQPHAIEQHWYATWEKNHYFSPAHLNVQPYTIVLPPPNVTGSLHMGHGFQATLMDILIRYHRMLGEQVLWQPGTDHAGIATQMVVEKKLLLAGKSRHDLGREAFVEKIWEWKQESGDNITRQFRRLGASLDWSRECFTMDERMSDAVRQVFIQLYQEGLIYRSTRLVNWDPVLLTAISDLEVINHEEEGKLWHIRYPLVEGPGHLTVATTRPETLLGDVAVAVHPDDKRYQSLIGKQLHLPLTERTVPIIADESVDPSFGSGAVKITPAHDFNDYAVGQRHRLPLINIFTPDAHINQHAPQAYQGLERFAARKAIIKDLEYVGVLEKTENHILKIPRGEKSDSIIEPYLTQQWFMKMKSLAGPAVAAVERGDIQFVPENWTKTYFQWLHHIEDWCISRQLWWGHRIPVWQDEQGQEYVGHHEEDIRQRYQLAATVKLKQDNDVLDTWFSAALWPFVTLGWPDRPTELSQFYPTQVLVTGFDIIFFWVARMIMLGLKFTGQVPFKEVFITGLVRDAEGHKMSKSKGNVLDPINLIDGIGLEALVEKRTSGLMQPAMAQKIEKATRQQFPQGIPAHGTDALRFTFCALASYGREVRFDLKRLEGYRNFCNKLWNAARYVLMNIEGKTITLFSGWQTNSHPIHRWLVSRLQKMLQATQEHLTQYRFDLYAQALYEFIWNEFCDWYLELSKPILTHNACAEKDLIETRTVLLYTLDNILRALHPIMPFITEDIWQRIAPLLGHQLPNSIMLQACPLANPAWIDENAEEEISWIKNFIMAIRTFRSEMNIPPNKIFSVVLKNCHSLLKKRCENYANLMLALAKLERIDFDDTHSSPVESATIVLGEVEIHVPLAGLIDKQEETARLKREITGLQKDMQKVEAKLNNPQFKEKAPAEVIAKEQAKLLELKTTLAILEKRL